MQREYRENDLILLCRDPPESCESEPPQHALGIVVGQEDEQYLKVRFFLPHGIEDRVDTVRSDLRLETKDSRGWFLQKVCNLSTVLREYLALHHVRSMKFSKLIVTGDQKGYQISRHIDGRVGVPPKLKEALASSHNPSQLQAVMAGMSTSPLILIQGPPGTGKTQTIIGLISVVVHSDSRYADADFLGASSFAPSDLSTTENQSLWAAASPWLKGDEGLGSSALEARAQLLASNTLALNSVCETVTTLGGKSSETRTGEANVAAKENAPENSEAQFVNRALRKMKRILVSI